MHPFGVVLRYRSESILIWSVVQSMEFLRVSKCKFASAPCVAVMSVVRGLFQKFRCVIHHSPVFIYFPPVVGCFRDKHVAGIGMRAHTSVIQNIHRAFSGGWVTKNRLMFHEQDRREPALNRTLFHVFTHRAPFVESFVFRPLREQVLLSQWSTRCKTRREHSPGHVSSSENLRFPQSWCSSLEPSQLHRSLWK